MSTPRVTYAEYLVAEEKAVERHEYLAGMVWAMSGGTHEHGRLTASLVTALNVALKGRRCMAFASDLRVRVEATDFAAYPDVTVVCGKIEPASDDKNSATNPTLVVEVLSESTERYDRGEKFANYRRIASLKEYVLVSQDKRRVELFRRSADQRWEFLEFEGNAVLELESVAVTVPLADLYDNPLA